MKRQTLVLFALLMLAAVLLAACGGATEAPTEEPVVVEDPVVEEGLPDLGGLEVTIAIENAYLPFNYIDLETGEPGGWDYDAWDEICKRLNCTPVYVEAVWDGMIQAVSDGQFDAAADGITITADRAEIVDFSIGYVAIDQRLLVRIDEDRIESIDDIVNDESLALGTQTGTTNFETAASFLPEERIQAFEQFPFAVQALIAGDIDAVIIDETAGQGYLGENAESLKLVGPSMSSDELGFIFPKGSDLVDPVNQALEAMAADGFLSALNTEYFGPGFTVTYDDIGDGAYAEEPIGTEDNPIVWVLVPSQDVEVVLTGAEEIAQAIEDGTGLIVEPLVTTDFTGAVEAMCSNEAHMGALNTFNYVLASARGCAEVAVASVRFGTTFYSGQVITTADSGIESIADLAGKTFCRPDPTSTSGWVIPSIAMQAAGLDPEADLAEIVDAGGHDGVVLAVYNGDCDAGSTFVDARGNVEEDFPDVRDVVIVIEESAPIPNDNISYAPVVPADVRDAVTGVLLDLASSEEGLEVLNSVYSWSGMEVVDDSFYDGFRQQLEAAGIDIEELIN